jgi:vacuolar-type H+-ATPase subunit H
MIQSVARQPELRGELQGIQWLGFALTEAVVFYGLLGSIWRTCWSDGPRRKPADPGHAGLMIWTIVCFLIALFVLKRYAFGPIQKLIDERRERIRRALDEADEARVEARKLLEEHRKLIGEARGEAEDIRTVARHEAEAQLRRVKDEAEATASAGSRRRSARSKPRRGERSRRSGPRSPSSA